MIFRHPRAPLVFGILAITGLAGFLALYRSSPGKLSRPHDKVAGMSLILSCNKCHAPQGLSEGCLNCHKEIRAQLDGKQGYHATLLKDKKMECARCHGEHNGEEFRLVNKVSWQGQDFEKFSHPHVDFKLKGKHQDLKCDACHKGEKMKPFVLPDFPGHPRENTYLGLSQDCASCHKDPHAGGLAVSCEKCHGQDSFKPAPFFNHDKFYPLRNKHVGVACDRCHVVPKGGAVQKTEAFPFAQVRGKLCQECHRDPHRTPWKQSCETCHSRDALPWSEADKKMNAKNHALTGFRLAQPHQSARCDQCHLPGASFDDKYPDPAGRNYKRSEKSCEGCHRDIHAGQFADKYPRCVLCHKEAGFLPAKFGSKDHKAYPLQGGHAAVPCFMCHAPDKKTGVKKFSGLSRACASCHRDVHRGQFAKNGQTSCEECHASFASWNKTIFDHNRQSLFKLDEAHENVDCKICHLKFRFPDGNTVTLYKPLKRECKDCHALDIKK